MGGNNNFQYAPNPVHWVDPWGLTSLFRKMKTNLDGSFINSPLSGSPNMNQKGARTALSNPKHNDFIEVLAETDMVGPDHTGKKGLSCSLDESPAEDLNPGQVNGKIDSSDLPDGLSSINDHGRHVSIYQTQNMQFSQFQSLLNKINWKK